MASADFSISLEGEISHGKPFYFQQMIQDLHSRLRITFRLRSPMPACRPRYALYPVSVRYHLPLPSASFRQCLTTPPLPSANSSQLSTSIRDLHPIVKEHAWRTKKKLQFRWSFNVLNILIRYPPQEPLCILQQQII